MDYAKRIGQVGALAVVLGVGAAVTTHAIGSAAPTDPSFRMLIKPSQYLDFRTSL